MTPSYDVLILGGGPAGYTAALYAARANLKVLVLAGTQPGGQLTTTTVIENFPGFRDGIDGNALMADMRAQAERFGATLLNQSADGVTFSKAPFTVHSGDDAFTARSVIVATGAAPRKLGTPSEERLWAKGVSSCATCDGFFFRGKTVAVLGGGDSAMEEAHFLTSFATEVHLIHRRDAFRASPIMLERARKNPKIRFHTPYGVEEILGETHVTGIRLKHAETGAPLDIPLDGVFLAIGHLPNTGFLKGQVDLDAEGYILHSKNTMTSIPGVFAAGDCVDHRYRQAVTAAGMGCQAALDAQKWLEAQD